MTYHLKPTSTSRRAAALGELALGDTWDTVKSMSVGIDPYLPEVLCRVDQLRALAQGRSPLSVMFGSSPNAPVPYCANTPDGMPGGIGVKEALAPLRAAVYVYQTPAVAWLALSAILGLPFLLGYATGKGSSK